jgi:hypothetical protein
VSPNLNAESRREAHKAGKTPNALVVETLAQAKLPSAAVVHDDLDWLIGKTPGGEDEPDAAQTWLDALPTEPA